MKRYYGMTAASILSHAPFSVIYREWPALYDWKPRLVQGYVVVDRYGDKVWPLAGVIEEARAQDCATELNTVAAKHFMESEIGRR